MRAAWAIALALALGPVAVVHGAPGAGDGTVGLLAEGHRLLRAGRPRAAQQRFERVLERTGGTPLAAYAQLGLAWTSLARGDLTAAEVFLEDAIPVAGTMSPGAEIVLALLHGAEGRTDAAVALLDRATATLADRDLRDAALLAKGYVLYWAGELDRAAAAFDAVAVPGSGAVLADDARYGAAWSRWRAGDHAAAEAALRTLAETAGAQSGAGAPEPSRALADLRPRAVLADAVARYRRVGLQQPERAVVILLDADGAARARRALARVAAADTAEAEDLPGVPIVDVEEPGEQPGGQSGRPAAAGSLDTDPSRSPTAPPAPRGGLIWLVAAAVVVAAALAILRMRRRAPR